MKLIPKGVVDLKRESMISRLLFAPSHPHVFHFQKVHRSISSNNLTTSALPSPYGTAAFDPRSEINPPGVPELSRHIPSLLSRCGAKRDVGAIHAHVLRTRYLESNPDAFHYNNIIRAYALLDSPRDAVLMYVSMSHDGVLPDCYTIPVLLKAVCLCSEFEFGRQVHCVGIRTGLDCNEYCESGFISLYSKFGDLGSARKVFHGNGRRILGSWNALLAGLSQRGRAEEVIEVFLEMRRNGFFPDGVTMVSMMSACGSIGDFDLAVQLHKYVLCARGRKNCDILMENSVIDMYGKCGRMDLAYRIFSRMEERNVSSWTSMIVGYAMHGYAAEALECFRSMRETNVRPNYITFIGVLSACVHGGMVQEGRYYFVMMQEIYGIVPQMQHYGCMVDLLGRAGLLDDAREMVESMPMRANVVVLGCLMGACEKYRNVKTGEWVAKHLKELEPMNDGVYVALANIYASNGMWEEVARMRSVLKEQELAKVPGFSLTD
ncbi:hypothetical protein MLD38_027382 [Melastoma candidum]|uniref:Uncharacterized protein n=2 Tax=Melastoma candidum TaxID=119954 RepID=A0ACB9P228_9MYRT|nr:hypothetical protein MLD38_027382 [Melastoma candidum]